MDRPLDMPTRARWLLQHFLARGFRGKQHAGAETRRLIVRHYVRCARREAYPGRPQPPLPRMFGLEPLPAVPSPTCPWCHRVVPLGSSRGRLFRFQGWHRACVAVMEGAPLTGLDPVDCLWAERMTACQP